MGDPFKRLAEAPVPQLSVAELHRRLELTTQTAHTRRVRSRRLKVAAASAAVLALLAVGIVMAPFGRATEEVAQQGARFSSGQGELAVALGSATSMTLSAASEAKVLENGPQQTTIGLDEGTAVFNVDGSPQRLMAVRARGVRVTGRGRFSISLETSATVVTVSRGYVDVVTAAVVRRVVAGERIVVTTDGATLADDEAVLRRPPGPTAEAEPVAPSPAPLSRAASETVKPQRPPARVQPAPQPEDLFEVALAHKRDGRHVEAAAAWEAFLAQHPNDPRATRVAYELGRVRMDRLSQPTAARALFERVVSESRDPFLGEDALARLVRLADGAGDAAACRAWRARYLEQFAQGAYLGSVESACAANAPR